MKLFKQIDINFKYALNKQTLIFILISQAILVTAFFFNTNIFSSLSSKILYENDYFNSYVSNSYNVLIVIYGFFSVFLSIVFSNKYDLYLVTRRPRFEVALSKILCGALILLIYIYISFAFSIIIPCTFMRYFEFRSRYLLDYLLIYLNGLFLLLCGMILMELFNNYFSSFIVLVLYWSMKIFTHTSIKKGSFIYFLNCVFPTLLVDDNNIKVYFPNNLFIVLMIFILGISYVVYYKNKNAK